MGYTAEKLVAIALAEVGYLEKRTNEQLDDKTANAGYNNYTKYGRDLYAAGYYNGNKNGIAWCDQFNDWCHYMAADKDAKLAQQTICQTGSMGAGCKYSANYYRNAGRFFKTPKVGDQIFFGKTGQESHTGIVVKVTSTEVFTVEGNTRGGVGVIANGGGVYAKSYALNDENISGYGRPKYDEVKKEETKVNIELDILKNGSAGEQVETLQRLLSTYGYKLGSKNPFDGKFGKMTEDAVKAFQKDNGLFVDGVVGKKTWAKLLGV